MSQENLYELNISAADLQTVQSAVQTLVNVLGPHLINLTADERRELPKMGDKSLAFVRKAREYAANNPELVPAYLSVPMFDADLRSVDTLNNLLRTLQPLLDNLEDSLVLAGSESYQAALCFYSAVKGAARAGQPRAKTIAEDLAARFPTGRVKPASAKTVSG